VVGADTDLPSPLPSRYYGLNQHLMSIQPTGVFGMYEERNTVVLPTRFDIPIPQKGKK